MEEYSAYVGLDVHKETIVVAVAYPGRSKPKSLGDVDEHPCEELEGVEELGFSVF